MLLTMCTYLQIDTNYNCIQELSQDTNYNCIQGLSQDFPSPSSLGFHSALLIQNMNSAGSNSQISGFCCKLLIRILLFMAKGNRFAKIWDLFAFLSFSKNAKIFEVFCAFLLESAPRKNAKISHKKTNAEKQNGTKNTEEKLLIMICSSNVELSEQLLGN